MAVNNFKPFGVGKAANVSTQADYEALPALDSGFSAGKASSAQINKALRQGTVMSSVLAQFIANLSGKDVLDDGNTQAVLNNLIAALKANGSKDFLQTANSLAEIKAAGPDAVASALANLGLGEAAKRSVGMEAGQVPDASDVNLMVNNAVSNLGFGSAASRDVGTLQPNQIPDMSAWTSGGNSTFGWRRSPDGFIEQWGRVKVSALTTVTTPIPFPNSMDTVIATGDPYYSNGIETVQAWISTNNTFILNGAWVLAGNIGTTTNMDTLWRAWGR